MTGRGVAARADARPDRGARSLSLRLQVALVIAVLSVLPNLVLGAVILMPVYRRAGVDEGVWLTLALWLALVVALSVAIAYGLSRQLLAPLLAMTRDVTALPATSRRISTARLAVTGAEPTEVHALKRAFNELLEQIHVEQSRRTSFTATLMHDLKTPLIAANHLLNVVRDNSELTREARIELVSRLHAENHALIELVQKLIEAHRFEREDVPLQRERVDLAALVRATVDRVAPLTEERGVTVRVRGAAEASVDPKELGRALYNLVSNAVRYARSTIEVEVFPNLVRLSDDGPGLPAPLETLAQPFNAQPVEIAGRRYTAGTAGLGLFIARRIVEAHGGRLVAEASGARGTVLLAYLGEGARRAET